MKQGATPIYMVELLQSSVNFEKIDNSKNEKKKKIYIKKALTDGKLISEIRIQRNKVLLGLKKPYDDSRYYLSINKALYDLYRDSLHFAQLFKKPTQGKHAPYLNLKKSCVSLSVNQILQTLLLENSEVTINGLQQFEPLSVPPTIDSNLTTAGVIRAEGPKPHDIPLEYYLSKLQEELSLRSSNEPATLFSKNLFLFKEKKNDKCIEQNNFLPPVSALLALPPLPSIPAFVGPLFHIHMNGHESTTKQSAESSTNLFVQEDLKKTPNFSF